MNSTLNKPPKPENVAKPAKAAPKADPFSENFKMQAMIGDIDLSQ